MDELMDTQESQKVYVVGGQHLQNALLTEFLDKASITASAVKSVWFIPPETRNGFTLTPVYATVGEL